MVVKIHKHFSIGKFDVILSTTERSKFFRYKKTGPFRLLDFWIIRIIYAPI